MIRGVETETSIPYTCGFNDDESGPSSFVMNEIKKTHKEAAI